MYSAVHYALWRILQWTRAPAANNAECAECSAFCVKCAEFSVKCAVFSVSYAEFSVKCVE